MSDESRVVTAPTTFALDYFRSLDSPAPDGIWGDAEQFLVRGFLAGPRGEAVKFAASRPTEAAARQLRDDLITLGAEPIMVQLHRLVRRPIE